MRSTLQTSSRTFITDPDHWLGQSDYFDRLFSGKFGGDDQGDRTYFIEADAAIFEHILRFLRTGVLPVFYNHATGHDFALYHSVFLEAEYFQITRLCRWIKEKTYLSAVYVTIRAWEPKSAPSPDRMQYEADDVLWSTSTANELTVTPLVQRRSVFYCPTGHHGQSDARLCRSCIDGAVNRSSSIGGGWRAEDRIVFGVVRREVGFDHELCKNAFTSDWET